MSRRSNSAADAIDPKILAKLKGEDQFIQSENRSVRRVKVERGKIWVVRFLPAKLGPEDSWFARISRHWCNGKPVVCPRSTGQDFGGNPKFDCPICHVSDELNASSDEAVSKFGYSVRATPQWTTYCVVFEKDDVEQSLAEVLQPYVFDHYKSTWEELKAFYMSNASTKNANSILDYHRGNDFSVSRTGKGMRLDKLDSQEIFPDEPRIEDYISKIESAIKDPKVTIPSEAELRAFKIKIEEASSKIENGDGGKPRGRRAAMEEDDDDTVKPKGRNRRDSAEDTDAKPERSRRAAADDDDDVPYDKTEKPEKPSRKAPPTKAADDDDASDIDDDNVVDDDDDVDIDADDGDANDDVDADGDDGDDVAEVRKRPSGKLPPPPAAVAKSGRRSREEIEEDDNVADEKSDPAPPRKARVRGDVIDDDDADDSDDADADADGADNDDDLPRTTRRGSEGLTGKIANMKKRRG